MPKPVVKPKETPVEEDSTAEEPTEDTAVETTSQDSESEETSTEQATEVAEPSAEELLEQLRQENAQLKEQVAAKPKEEPEPLPKTGEAIQLATQSFFRTTLPSAKQTYANDKATGEQKFEAIYDMANKLVGAVLQDQLLPAIVGLYTDQQLIRLERDSRYASVESKVKEEISKLSISDLAKANAVRQVFFRILGERDGERDNGKKLTATPEATRGTAPALKPLRDLAAGTTAPTARVSASAGLTAEQEEDRKQIEAESDTTLPPKMYLARLKARQDKIKAENEGKPKEQQRRIPKMLRELV